eukprot:7431449-Alexandrium_andersonii.AAC.1
MRDLVEGNIRTPSRATMRRMSSRLDVCAIAWDRVLHQSDARTVGSLGTDASEQSGFNFLCTRTDEVVMSSSMSPAA